MNDAVEYPDSASAVFGLVVESLDAAGLSSDAHAVDDFRVNSKAPVDE